MRRHAYVLWRAPHRWFDIVVWPLMDVLLWGSIGTFVARQAEGTQSSAPYMIAGIVMFHVLFQSQIAVAVGFMEETWSRNLLNVVTTPVTEIEYVAGTALFGILKVFLALTTLSITAIAFFGFGLDEIGWSIIPIAAILTIVGWGVGIANIGLVLRMGQGAEMLVWGMNFLLMALSGVFFPIDALPGPLQPLGRLLPSTHAFDALRDVLDGEPLPGDRIAAGFAGAALFVVVGFVFSAWMLRVFRRRGLVTRFS
jgi:ABC-2 type transport system permease protein